MKSPFRGFHPGICRVGLAIALFVAGPGLRAGVVLSEFLASNNGGLADEAGNHPAWIEIHNDSTTVTNIAGWHLTDRVEAPNKWTFPPTNLPPGTRLIVFASGNDRRVAGAPLHTNFKLDADGEYLALIAPDGVTAATEFAPAFPRQHGNISFGSGTELLSQSFVAAGSAVRYFVPTNGLPAGDWTQPVFADATWKPATVGLGYDTNQPAGGSGAVLLSLDINERGSAPITAAGFSSFVINSNGGVAAVQTLPTTRTIGGLTVTVSNTLGQAHDDRIRATPVNAGTFTESTLLRDFIFSRDTAGTGGLDVVIAGLPSAQSCRVSLWSFDSGSPGSRVSDWYANGVLARENWVFNGSILPVSNDDYRFDINAVADAQGRLVIAGRRDAASVDPGGAATFGVFLNALRLTQLGYRSALATDLENELRDRSASVLVRVPFVVSAPAAIQQLRLRMRYDDGFTAYLNGQLIASCNAPVAPDANSTATAERPGASGLMAEEFLLANTNLLVIGTNVLAIHGFNVAANDADYFIEPELTGFATNTFTDRYFATPTPGAANGTPLLGVVADTKFSVDRGFYDAPFSLSITSATAEAAIYFTTDGSTPSPTNGLLLSAPLFITNTALIRAAAFKPGWIPSDVDTHSYLFLQQVVWQPAAQPGYPTIWQADYPADYGMDPGVVNHPVYGATLSNDLRSIPSLSIVSDPKGLWSSATGIYPNSTSRGPAWERAASLELIAGSGATEFAVNCKLELHGNASRDNVRTPKHSLHVTFSSDYGPTKLTYDWFNGGVAVHDKIVLRSCGFVDGWAGRYADNGLYTSTETGESFRGLRYRPENTCYLRDAWVKDSFRAMGWHASRSQFVHLYLNGLYWGLYQPSEAINAAYFAALEGGPEEAWDVVVGEDNDGPPVVVDGSLADWQNVLNLVNAGITTEAAYQAIAQRVDLDNLIDYMMVHIVAESEDWPRHNWYVAHRRATNGVPGTKFVCTVWDQELTLDRLVRRNRINVGTSGGEIYGPGRVYSQLRAWPEFRRQFGDRVQKHLFNGGALTPGPNASRLLAPAAVIRHALVGESARWGDARKTGVPAGQIGTGVTFTRDEWWQPEIDRLATNFFQKLTADNVARFRAGSLYPAVSAPQFNPFGGVLPNGVGVVLTHTNASGTIYFTTDGSDPRQYGSGAVAATAQAYTAAVPLAAPTLVRARVLRGAEWSALVEAQFYTAQEFARLELSELHYNPPKAGLVDGENFEFLELHNAGTNLLRLDGLILTDGISFTFPNGATLAAGGYLVLVGSATNFVAHFPGVAVNGEYAGKLDNGGERVTLSFPFGGEVFSLRYNDKSPWPTNADGFGFSLQRANSRPDYTNAANWCAAPPTPGGPPPADCLDSDADGMPDFWEVAHGTDPLVNDAAADPDHDGLSNLEEYQAGTDPNDAASALRVLHLRLLENGTSIELGFPAAANRTYALQFRDAVNYGAWQTGQEVPVAPTNRSVVLTEPLNGISNRFFRISVTGRAF